MCHDLRPMEHIMHDPLVSVCVPLYNGARFIQAAIISVQCQTYSNWELIVGDDGSTDGSGDLIKQYADFPFRYYRNEIRMGMQGNFNRLLAAANGKYFKLLCQDDVLHPDCLRRQVEVMERPGHERIVLVTCTREIVDAHGAVLFRRQWHRKDTRIPGLVAIRHTIRAGTNLIGEPSAVLFRTSSRDQYGTFNGRFPFAVDLDYWIRLLRSGDCYYLVQSLCQFRISRYSESFSIAWRQGSQFFAFARFLNHDSCLSLSWWDYFLGILGAHVKALLRQLVYLIYWRRLSYF